MYSKANKNETAVISHFPSDLNGKGIKRNTGTQISKPASKYKIKFQLIKSNLSPQPKDSCIKNYQSIKRVKKSLNWTIFDFHLLYNKLIEFERRESNV
ncbi:hypothetical protein CEF21_16715 [Bacillus sp. FJAT-42376]|nr:hypothetical protein CEF21_16715 [Bacillus sp. FJAT-42376]